MRFMGSLPANGRIACGVAVIMPEGVGSGKQHAGRGSHAVTLPSAHFPQSGIVS
jgi:hypothetical protein